MPPTPLKTAPRCYGCGSENPAGLGLQPYLDEDGRVRAAWTPRREFRGLSHITHGGVLTAACDEMMGFALTVRPLPGTLYVTTKLEMRFLRPVPLETPMTLEAWVAAQRGTNVFTRCRLVGPNGKDHATARATFVEVPEHLRPQIVRT